MRLPYVKSVFNPMVN